ncbi:unnamed protein product [Prorocentrum cordatum]|uniref:Sulfhydryl oxidase n=1 Tax=Prorocentrum cordatum TaxID=2364126 RepID=A0ABN9PWA1_9DINO|nr:unnamed protein product [Polarella glacialis]
MTGPRCRRSLLAVACVCTCIGRSAGVFDGGDEEHDLGTRAAQAAWAALESVVHDDAGRGASAVDWRSVESGLAAVHPHAEASAALGWLHLFGVPGASGDFAPPGGFRRDVDRAVTVLREGAALSGPACGRCYALLGLLLTWGIRRW